MSIVYKQSKKENTAEAAQKFRDILKSASIMKDDKAFYVLLGIESQSDVNYSAPVKNAVYDMLQYEKQVKVIAVRHKRNKDYKGRADGEFLSGFYKEDRLIPVITLIVFFSPDKWDGPKSLHEMMKIENPKIKKFVQNYRINLIEPYAMNSEELNKFRTDFREVMQFMKILSDSDKMTEYLSYSDAMKKISTSAALVINEYAGLNLNLDEGSKYTDMSNAIEILKQRAADAAYDKGYDKGRKEESIRMARNMMRDNMDKASVAKYTGLTEDEVDNILA